jgi:hypothetical protein
MSLDPKRQDVLDRLTERLRHAPAPTVDLLSDVIASACTRLPSLNRTGQPAQIARLINIGAWHDAVLALIKLELPAWSLRRLVQEDGEWLCSLSKQPNLPLALDSTADGRHDVLALAILNAFVEARRGSGTAHEANVSIVPQIRPTSVHAACCDDFA